MERLPYLREFYFGDGVPGLRKILDRKIADIDARQVCSFPVGTDEMGREAVVRVGRFGTYVQRGEATAPLPPDSCPDEVDLRVVSALLAEAERTQQPLGLDPETQEPIYLKRGRFGPYVQLGNAVKGSRKKPKMVSLLATMDPSAVDLPTALRLLSLPRSLGTDPEGREVLACTGRYGPYVKRGEENASLRTGDDVLTIELPRAIELFALKGKRGRRTKGAEPLRVFPAVEALGGADVRLLEGRYGPYVTDGKVNATLPKGSDPAALTVEQAVDLLKARAEKGPAKRPPRRRAR
jgi:DNA topoisomerase-1